MGKNSMMKMIDCKTAIKIVKEYFNQREDIIITQVYDAENMWVVFTSTLGKENIPRFDSIRLAVDKMSGKIDSFYLPDRKNFDLLKSAKKVF